MPYSAPLCHHPLLATSPVFCVWNHPCSLSTFRVYAPFLTQSHLKILFAPLETPGAAWKSLREGIISLGLHHHSPSVSLTGPVCRAPKANHWRLLVCGIFFARERQQGHNLLLVLFTCCPALLVALVFLCSAMGPQKGTDGLEETLGPAWCRQA